MRRVLAIMLAWLLAPLPAAAGELILRDVIELHRTGLGDDLLVAVIEADGSVFRLGFADIQDLRSDGLSERVISALVRTGARVASATDAARPLVQVSQQVITYAPTVVVLHPPPLPQRQVERDGRTRRPERASPPPATWITPRDPKPREAATAPTPRPDPR